MDAFDTTIAGLRRLADASAQYVPIPPRSKKPDNKRWQHQRHDWPAIEAHLRHGGNAGLLLVDGWTDIDLDSDEAIAVAADFLPATGCTFGRGSARRSHWIFRCDPLATYTKYVDPLEGDRERATLLELRAAAAGKGLQTVVPGSTHPSGESITFDEDGEPAPIDADKLMVCVSDLAATCLLGRHWPAKGTRHDAALAAAGFLLRGGLDEPRTARIVCQAARVAGDEEWRERRKDVESTAAEVRAGRPVTGGPTLTDLVGAKILDALSKWLQLRRQGFPSNATTNEPTGPDGYAGDAFGVGLHLTDLGNAQRLVRSHGADLRYCAGQGGWYGWDGRRWRRDTTNKVMRLAKQVVLDLYKDAATLSDDARKALLTHAQRSEGEPRLRAMVVLATSEAAVARDADGWDADPWVLNVKNGIIDLRTGALRPHRREDHLTKLAPVVYEPNATLDLWERFLSEALDGNAALIAFLKRLVGYTLTGDTSEEKLALIHGPEASGKSTFIEAVKATLGDYAITTDFETFLKRPTTGGPRNDLARLAGARMVASIEVEDGKALAEGVVKAMTGGDTVTARLLYREHFEYVPAFTLWLAANHAPRVRDDDGAMWRRILRIPFEHTIAPDKRDPKVKATLRDPKHAGPAILAWAVQGCLEWQRTGLGVPQSVTDATAAYREDNDPLRDFVAERCVVTPDAWAFFDELWAAYQAWAHGDRWALSRNAFAERLTRRGWLRGRGARGMRIRKGIGLATDSATEGDSENINSPRARASARFSNSLSPSVAPPVAPDLGLHGWVQDVE